MYISKMELIKEKLAADGRMSESNIIKQILEDDKADEAKLYMKIGEKYYRGEHDILNHDFRKSTVYENDNDANGYNSRGVEVINENNSNHHNVHNFFQQQVDQKASYIAGNPLSVTVEGAENNAELKDFEYKVTEFTSDEEFSDMLDNWITGASNKGVEWLHVFYDEYGELQTVIIPAEEVIPFYDTAHQKKLTELIRWYEISSVVGGKEKKLRRVEWWKQNSVAYYIENEKGEFVLDNSKSNNPSAHWYNITTVDGAVTQRKEASWGRVPFIPLYNNKLHTSDLKRIKGLQDAYNLISSASTNNQIDLVELYWMIQGYGGETAKAVQRKLQLNHAVTISDPQGKISAEQVTLSVSERISWLKLLRSDIYNLGMAIDTTAENFATAPSGVALEFLYTPLDLKAKALINKLKLALKELFWFFTQDINLKNGTAYRSDLIRADVNKGVITNDLERVEIIERSRGLVPDILLLAKHPLVDDVNQAVAELEKQRRAEAERFLNSDIPPKVDDE